MVGRMHRYLFWNSNIKVCLHIRKCIFLCREFRVFLFVMVLESDDGQF